jgi:hypothetical protein
VMPAERRGGRLVCVNVDITVRALASSRTASHARAACSLRPSARTHLCVRVPWVRARSRSLGFCAPARPSCRAPSARRGCGWWRVVVATWPAAYRPLACQKACGAAQPLVSEGARQGERRRRLCGRKQPPRAARQHSLARQPFRGEFLSGAMGRVEASALVGRRIEKPATTAPIDGRGRGAVCGGHG